MDTNVLVTAHAQGVPNHLRVRRFVLDLLEEPNVTIVLCPVVINEFLHTVTDPRRFSPPITMDDAITVVQGYLDRVNVECLPLDCENVDTALALTRRYALGRKRVSDTFIAASLIDAHVPMIVTLDNDDFALFEEHITVVNPVAR